jgi:two-component system OmpR family response regulator
MVHARVLIVEDEPTIGELLCGILDVHGFQSRLAMTGREGVKVAMDWRPDLVLLDVMLPDMDGFEVCRTIRSTAGTPVPGIVMLTALITHEGRLRGFRSGTDRFLTKPFQVDSLVSELESVLQEYRSGRRGLRSSTALLADAEATFVNQVHDLLVDLAQKTPLSPAEIESIGAGLKDLGERIRQWGSSHPAGTPEALSKWELVCQVYRDRFETHLTCSDTAVPPDRDRLHELFGLTSNQQPIAVTAALADQIDFPDHGSVAVLVRRYSGLPV